MNLTFFFVASRPLLPGGRAFQFGNQWPLRKPNKLFTLYDQG